MKELLKREKYFVAAMTLVALALRLIYMLLCDNYLHGDTGARLQTAFQWMHFPRVFVGYDWLPFHFYLLGGLMKLTGDVVWAPRLLGVVLGAASVVPFYYIVKELFGERNARYSAFLLVILGNHVLQSILTLSDVPTIFFLLAGIYFLLQFIKHQKPIHILTVVLFMSMFNLTRYEGWLYSALIAMVLLYERVAWRWIVVYCILVNIGNGWYMYDSWRIMGHPFHGLLYSDYEVLETAKIQHFTIGGGLSVIHMSFVFLSVFLVPLGIYRSLALRGRHGYIFLFALPFLYAAYKELTFTLTTDPRYFLMSAVLSLPFLVSAFIEARSGFLQRVSGSTFFIGLLFVLNAVKSSFLLIDPVWVDYTGKFPEGFMTSATWTKKHLPQSRIYLDNKDLSNYHWMVYANQLMINHENPTYGIAALVTGRFWVGEVFSSDSLERELSSKAITHLVLFKNGEIDNYLGFSKQKEQWRGYEFDKECDFEGYKVYHVKKPMND